MNPDELAQDHNTKVRLFAQAYGFQWHAVQPHLVAVDLLSFSKSISVDLSAVDPDRFLDGVLNRVFLAGKRNGERDFKNSVLTLFKPEED